MFLSRLNEISGGCEKILPVSGSLKAVKLQNKNLFFKSALLILTVSMNSFHSTNLFCCFSRYQAPANSVAPPSVYKPHTTHNSSIRSDEGLTLETSAFESPYGGQFTLSTQLIKPNYLAILPLTQHHSFFRNLPPLLILFSDWDCVHYG